MKYKQTISAIVASAALMMTAAAVGSNDSPDTESEREQLRQLLDQRSNNWMIRYDGDDSVHVMFLTDIDPQIACDAGDQAGVDVQSVKSRNTNTVQCD